MSCVTRLKITWTCALEDTELVQLELYVQYMYFEIREKQVGNFVERKRREEISSRCYFARRP